MAFFTRSQAIAPAFLAALALAGCQGVASRQPVEVAVVTPAPAPVATTAVAGTANTNGLNGRWLPTDEASRGVYVAEFRNGAFVSRAPGSSDALARGSYKQNGDRVALNFVGAVSKTEVNATCERRSATTLYCVPTVGSPFNLRRA